MRDYCSGAYSTLHRPQTQLGHPPHPRLATRRHPRRATRLRQVLGSYGFSVVVTVYGGKSAKNGLNYERGCINAVDTFRCARSAIWTSANCRRSSHRAGSAGIDPSSGIDTRGAGFVLTISRNQPMSRRPWALKIVDAHRSPSLSRYRGGHGPCETSKSFRSWT